MRTIWKAIPRPKKNGAWVGLYVTLSPRGAIVMNRVTWEKTGSPLAYDIFFDDANQRIGLKPSTPNSRGAYPAPERGKFGGRRILAYPVIVECRLVIRQTLQFPYAEIDPDGILILDLRTATVNKNSLAWERGRGGRDSRSKKRKPEPPKIEIMPGYSSSEFAVSQSHDEQNA
jgi:hypothetical protein